MSVFSERPGLRELMVTSLSNSKLAQDEMRECALDRVAAFGAAQISAVATLSGEGLEPSIAEIEIDERRVGGANAYASCSVDPQPAVSHAPATHTSIVPELKIDPRLGAILLRVKYVKASQDLVEQAVHLFARHLRTELPRRNANRARKELPTLLPKIAEQVIAEWMAGSCPSCHGTGRRGAAMDGVDERLVACRACERVRPESAQAKADPSTIGKPSGFIRSAIPLPDGSRVEARIGCPVCCGRLTVTRRKRVRGRSGDSCGRCYGFGHFVPRTVDRAVAIGVSEKTYQLRWAVIFDSALRAARALDRNLIESLRKQLGRVVL
jgi:hypothetical protein